MPTPTTAFRLTEHDRRKLDRLADELLLNRTEVIRHGLAALSRDRGLRKQILAEQLVHAFLDRLRARYGDYAQLRLDIGPGQPDPNPRIADEPLDYAEVEVAVRYEGEFAFVDLIDPTRGVGIRNAYWTEADDDKDVCLMLKAIDLYRLVTPTEEPRTYGLDDGRTVVAIPQEDGTVKQLVLDAAGKSGLLPDDQRAEWFGDAEGA